MTSRFIVSVIIPCRNERHHIGPCLESILSQDIDQATVEILVADGMSDDGTRDILDAYRAKHPNIRVIDNPRRIVSTGLNALIRAAHGENIVRMDVHTVYAADYLSTCVATLNSTGADNVGGPWAAKGRGYLQNAIALAFHHPFSSGGARSHRLAYRGPVDSVYLGCWKKSTLIELGLFDETLVRNQDDELNLRIVRRGGTVWQNPDIRSWYFPRAHLGKLFRQQMQYGFWKTRVIVKHNQPASLRHLVPGIFVALLMVILPLSFFSSVAWGLGLAILGGYALVSLFSSLSVCWSQRSWKYLPVLPLIFGSFHFGYGYGFLSGTLSALSGRGANVRFLELTRAT